MWKQITAKYLPNIELGIFKNKKYLAEAKNHYDIKACMHTGSRRDAWVCMLICWLHARRWQEGPVWSHSDFFDLVSDYAWYQFDNEAKEICLDVLPEEPECDWEIATKYILVVFELLLFLSWTFWYVEFFAWVFASWERKAFFFLETLFFPP